MNNKVKKCLWDENDYKPCELKAMDCDNCDYFDTEDEETDCIECLKCGFIYDENFNKCPKCGEYNG